MNELQYNFLMKYYNIKCVNANDNKRIKCVLLFRYGEGFVAENCSCDWRYIFVTNFNLIEIIYILSSSINIPKLCRCQNITIISSTLEI